MGAFVPAFRRMSKRGRGQVILREGSFFLLLALSFARSGLFPNAALALDSSSLMPFDLCLLFWLRVLGLYWGTGTRCHANGESNICWVRTSAPRYPCSSPVR
jgi:hypothetical protein